VIRTKRTCIKCGLDYELTPNKPGLITTCWDCSIETTQRIAGQMIWEGKHTPVLQLMSKKKAAEFARKTKRFGAGVSCALAPTGAETGNPGTKAGTGAEKRATYHSKLGEKRQVKD